MPVSGAKDKGRIRALSRRGVKAGKLHAGEATTGRRKEPRACERCGAIFQRRVWRREAPVTAALLARVTWDVCPACRQAERETGQGRVVLEGTFVGQNADLLRARMRNVAARAALGQPERRIVSLTGKGDVLDVLTTSQKLAHRIVRELQKAFRGRATYAWSDDGTLFARWRRDVEAAAQRPRASSRTKAAAAARSSAPRSARAPIP